MKKTLILSVLIGILLFTATALADEKWLAGDPAKVADNGCGIRPVDDSEPHTTFENIRHRHEIMRGGNPMIAPDDGGTVVTTASLFRPSEQELDNLEYEKEA